MFSLGRPVEGDPQLWVATAQEYGSFHSCCTTARGMSFPRLFSQLKIKIRYSYLGLDR